MGDVEALAAEEIVETDYFVTVLQQSLAKMRTEESRTASHQRSHIVLRQNCTIRNHMTEVARMRLNLCHRRFSRTNDRTFSIT